MNTGRTHFKKGQHPSSKTEFKKGTPKELHPRYIDGRSFKKSEYRRGKNPNSRNGFKKEHKFYGDLSKPNYFRKGDKIKEKNWNWKGGITKLNYLIRNSEKYIEWRLRVFENANWKCQGCGKYNCYFEAHHKKSFAKILQENNIKTFEEAMNCLELWDIKNGVCLCFDCHKKVDKYRRKFKNASTGYY